MAAMDIHDERDALANDGDVTVHRERAKTMLDQIAAEVKQTLTERGIDLIQACGPQRHHIRLH